MRAALRRVWRAACLDPRAYAEVAEDPGATGQAAALVILAAAASGLGAIGNHGLMGVLWHTLHGILLWSVWAVFTWLIGTVWLARGRGPGSDAVLRALGFASAPGLLRVFGVIPQLTAPFFALSGIWLLLTMYAAVREVMQVRSHFRVALLCLLGFPLYAAGLLASILLLGPWPV